MFFVYAIKSVPTKQIYIGQTEDIEKRLKYHNSGYVKATGNRKPWILIAIEGFEKRDKARWTERELKGSRGKQLKWIKENKINA